jgi:two-component system, LytTR family, response regulator
MKILIVDDEILARKRILKLLDNFEVINSIFQASSGKSAIQKINDLRPDIVFLDIQMTDMSGFDVLKNLELNKMPLIIFVTAYDKFAVKAFEVQAFDFLLKPFKNQRFNETLQRGIDIIKNEESKDFRYKVENLLQVLKNESVDFLKQEETFLEKIVLKINNKYYFIDTNDIKHILSSGYYAEIFTFDNEKHVYRISMTDFIKKLDNNKFIRVNRSTILRLSEIKEIISEGLGDYSIVMNDDSVHFLSKNYREYFLKKLNIKN